MGIKWYFLLKWKRIAVYDTLKNEGPTFKNIFICDFFFSLLIILCTLKNQVQFKDWIEHSVWSNEEFSL